MNSSCQRRRFAFYAIVREQFAQLFGFCIIATATSLLAIGCGPSPAFQAVARQNADNSAIYAANVSTLAAAATELANLESSTMTSRPRERVSQDLIRLRVTITPGDPTDAELSAAGASWTRSLIARAAALAERINSAPPAQRAPIADSLVPGHPATLDLAIATGIIKVVRVCLSHAARSSTFALRPRYSPSIPSAPTMKALFCWWTFEGHIAACWRALAARPGVSVAVVALRPNPDALAPYDPSVLAGVSSELHERSALLSTKLMHDRIAAHNPDVLVLPGWVNPAAVRVALAPALSGLPIVIASDRPWAGTLRQRAGRYRYAQYFRRADHFIACGSRAALLASHLGISQDRISVGMYGVDTDLLGRAIQLRSASSWPRSFLFAGRYVQDKGAGILARAYREYRASVSDPWPLRCCGRGPLADELKSAGAEDLGFVQPADMPRIMGVAGAFVLPSRFDPWGLALIEAAASGLPLICTRAIGSTEHVASAANARVVPPGDAHALAGALRSMHLNDGQLRAMGAESRRLSESQSAHASAEHWHEAIERAVEHRRAAASPTAFPNRLGSGSGSLARLLQHVGGGLLAPLSARRAAVHVLCFHQVSHAQQAELLWLIDALERTHEIVSYSEAVRRAQRVVQRPTVALTFDDGTRDHARVAAALAIRAVSACFFVCPDLLDGASDADRAARLCRDALRIPPVPLMGWSDLLALAAAGHEIGCHSASHQDMATLAPDRLDDQIAGARHRIIERGLPCVHFAWPFGRFSRFGAQAASRVLCAGFESCASAEHGVHAPPRPLRRPVCIRRIVVGEREAARSIIARVSLASAMRVVRDDGWPHAWQAAIPPIGGAS